MIAETNCGETKASGANSLIHRSVPWASAPAYLVRDNDRTYRHIFTTSRRGDGHRFLLDRHGKMCLAEDDHMGIAERLIGTLRRECLDHAAYYNQTRTHLALTAD